MVPSAGSLGKFKESECTVDSIFLCPLIMVKRENGECWEFWVVHDEIYKICESGNFTAFIFNVEIK